MICRPAAPRCFLEPRELIDLNNEIKVAELQVTREINRILQELTNRVVEHLQDLRSLLHVLTTLDCIGAKARLSARMNGTPVGLNTDGHVRLWNARHPLLPLSQRAGGGPMTSCLKKISPCW